MSSDNRKLFLSTKQRFLQAYSRASLHMDDFNDMLYYMNILYIMKPFDYGVNAKELYNDILTNKY